MTVLTGRETVNIVGGVTWNCATADIAALVVPVASQILAQPGAFAKLPTSKAGLATGTAWNNGGVLCVA